MRKIKECKVEEIMSRDVVTVGKETTIRELKELFEEHDFNAFPVVKGEKLIGIVTKLDLLKAFSMGRDFHRADYWKLFAENVGGVMREAVISLRPEETLQTAVEYMVEFRLRSLPVVERKRLVGVISRKDVMECLEVD